MNEGYEVIKGDELIGAFIVLCDRDILKEMNTGSMIPPHWHRSIEFSYVLKGDVHLVTDNEDRVIHENEFIFVNSGIMHSLYGDNLNSEVLIVIISHDFLNRMCPEIDETAFSYEKINEHKDVFVKIYQKIYETIKENDEYGRIKLHSLISDVLYNLLKYCKDDKEKQFSAVRKQKHWKLLDYIEEHYNEDLSLKTISAVSNVSCEYFSRSFKKISGVSYHEYLTKLRLQKSLNDLLDKNKRIGDIALDNGFSSVKSFISSFEKYYNMTPMEYRKSNIGNKSAN
ncbi:MAG: helix-turn-helix domain-containing protein [Erysipelotrichaceae bacterium]